MSSHSFVLQHPAGISVSADLTESCLLSALPEVASSRSDVRTGWVWYQLPPFSDGDVIVSISLGFNNDALQFITLSDSHAKFGANWSQWSEEEEHLRASSIGAWLAKKGFAVGQHPWGSVWVGYDAKGGFGSAAVQLAA